MLIDCDTCAVRGPACGDCVVTVLLGAPPAAVGDAVELDGAEQAAIAVLAGSGLVPPLRLLPVEPVGPRRPAGSGQPDQPANPASPRDRRPGVRRAAG
jgi:hypothetical protein